MRIGIQPIEQETVHSRVGLPDQSGSASFSPANADSAPKQAQHIL
jgi:hypothetical protein